MGIERACFRLARHLTAPPDARSPNRPIPPVIVPADRPEGL
jgi:hypothetical protein